jgi:ubiquinone/menaquinone biosynthesis C-methylase UbiE
LSEILEAEGFREVRFRRLTGGIVAVHEATA